MIAKYWRLRNKEASCTSWAWCWDNIELINELGVNITSTATITSSEETTPLANAFDGDANTYWQSSVWYQYFNIPSGREFVQFVFPTAVNIKTVLLDPHYTDSSKVQIEKSDDGNIWYVVARNTNATQSAVSIDIPDVFPAPSAQTYWAIRCVEPLYMNSSTTNYNEATYNVEVGEVQFRDTGGANLTPSNWKDASQGRRLEIMPSVPAVCDGDRSTLYQLLGTTYPSMASNINISSNSVVNHDQDYLTKGLVWVGTTAIIPDGVYIDCSTSIKANKIKTLAISYCPGTTPAPGTGYPGLFDWLDIMIIDDATAMWSVSPVVISGLSTGNPILLDVIKPVTTCSVPAGTYSTSQVVVLTANEPATIYYSLDGSVPSLTYVGSITITKTTTVKYFAVDTAGNREDTHTINIVIDTVPPETSIRPDGGLYSSIQDIVLTSNEPGITRYSINGGVEQVYTAPFKLSTPATITYYSTDIAGNKEEAKTATYDFDFIAPVTTITPLQGTFNRPIKLAMSTSEPGFITYTLNGGVEHVYTAPFRIVETTLVRYWATDLAGNQEVHNSAMYVLDVPPSNLATTISPAPGVYTGIQKITLTANEIGAVIKYAINGGVEKEYTEPIFRDKNTSITYYAIGAFSEEATKQAAYVINANTSDFIDYTGPIVLNQDTTILYYFDDGITKEDLRYAKYDIDLAPLMIADLPPSREHRYIKVDFQLNKAGRIFYSINGNMWTEFTEPFFLPAGSVEFRYFGIADGRTYPIVTKNYIITPGIIFVDITPSPISVYKEDTFLVTLNKHIM
jgi:hypothetical protein